MDLLLIEDLSLLLPKEYSLLDDENQKLVLYVFINTLLESLTLSPSLVSDEDDLTASIALEDIIENGIDDIDRIRGYLNPIRYRLLSQKVIDESLSRRRIRQLPKKIDEYRGNFKQWYINNFYTEYCNVDNLMCWSAALDNGDKEKAREYLNKAVIPLTYDSLVKYRYLSLDKLKLLHLESSQLLYVILHRIVDDHIEGKGISFRDMKTIIELLKRKDIDVGEVYATVIAYPSLFKISSDALGGKYNEDRIVKNIERDKRERRSHSIGTKKWIENALETNDKYISSKRIEEVIRKV